MRSPGSPRRWMERVARALALAFGAVLWWRVGDSGPEAGRVAMSTRELSGAFAHATRQAVSRLSLTIDSLPGSETRDWASALVAAGTDIQWTAPEPLPGLALSAEPLAGPHGGSRVTVLAPGAESLTVYDQLGEVDATLVDRSRVRVIEAHAGGRVRAAVTRGVAAVLAGDSALTRAVLVVAAASWEGRFTASALSESGWKVETDFAVADPSVPNADVASRVRSPLALAPLDTSRFAAVIALDSSALRRAGEIARFVKSGGGLVLGSAATTLPGIEALSPARRGSALTGPPGALVSATPRTGLSGRALVGLRSDAVQLEGRGDAIVAAARREEMGLVVAIGYADTWRWRMEGGPGALEAHRSWWSLLTRSVARLSPPAPSTPRGADPAPYAGLVASLGPPVRNVASVGERQLPAEWWLLGAICGLLVLEWASRRLRGAA